MSQAESTNITSRRSVLAVAASLAAGTVAGGAAILSTKALAAPPARRLDGSKPSPALKDAVTALRESFDRLEATRTRFAADDEKVTEWMTNNPEPTGKRAKRRYWRKFHDVREVMVRESWDAVLNAETDFEKNLFAVAKVKPRDEHDLGLKAAVAAIYDKERINSFEKGIISYSVAWDLLAMWGATVEPAAKRGEVA